MNDNESHSVKMLREARNMINKQEAIDLLSRVALRLEQRGIGPAADTEKLRALAHQLEQKGRRYAIMARWWNGHGFDEVCKEADTKKQLLGALKLLIDEVRPYQISITDSTQKPKLEEDPEL